MLYQPGNVIWEWGVLSMLTPWTDLDVRAVFGHLQAKLWQAARHLQGVCSGQEVVDLPRHLIMNIGAVPGLATRTVPSQREGEGLVCMLRHLQCLANMTTLSARGPTGPLALTLRRPWLVLIGWLTGGPAVLSQPGFQRVQPSEHLSQVGFQACAIRAGILADAPLYPVRRLQSRC